MAAGGEWASDGHAVRESMNRRAHATRSLAADNTGFLSPLLTLIGEFSLMFFGKKLGKYVSFLSRFLVF